MKEHKEMGLLGSIFILLLAVFIGSIIYKDDIADWQHMQPDARWLFILMYATLAISLLFIIAVFILERSKPRREKLRIGLVSLTILSCILSLFMEIGAYTRLHGGQQCFPYNLNLGISFHPAFLPLSINVNNQGHISLSGDLSFPVEIGEITIVADPADPPHEDAEAVNDTSVTTVVIRHRQGTQIVDTPYYLRSQLDSVQIVTTGLVVTRIKKNYYFIDVSQGQIKSTQINIYPANSACSASRSS